MPVLRIDQFGGLVPILDQRKLPDTAATVADWTRFDGGDVRAYRDVLNLTEFGNVNFFTLFRYGAVDPATGIATYRWLGWESVVNPVQSQVPADVHQRLYWIDSKIPYYASNPTQTMVLAQTPGRRLLGIPKPISKPSLALEGEALATSRVPSGITNAKPAVVTFATPHPFTEGQQVRIVIQEPIDDDAPQNMYELSSKEFVVAAVTSLTLELRSSDTSQMSELVDPSKATVDLVVKEADLESRVYVFNLVSDFGEEGMPSPPSDIIDVRREGGQVRVHMEWTRPAGYDHINKIRLYRTLTGSAGAQFFFVKDIPLPDPGNVIIETVDDVEPIKMGELMPSTDWATPPAGMFGLTAMPNGYMIAFNGLTVHVCEAYQPHAWPDKYRKTADSEIVGAASIGQSAIIATRGRPIIATGSDPSSLTLSNIEIDAPCIHQGSIVCIGDAIAYATYDGLAIIGLGEQRIVTQTLMTKEQWIALWTTNNLGRQSAYHDGLYLALSPNAAYPTFGIRLGQQGMQLVYFTGLVARAPAANIFDTTPGRTDTLNFCVIGSNSLFSKQAVFDAGVTLHAYSWKSKMFTQNAPLSFACGQVLASTYPVTLQVYAALETVSGPGALTLVHTQTVTSSNPFRLPSGFMAREWQVAVTGSVNLQSVYLATSMAELREQ